MTQGSVPKVLLQFAVPFLIANVLQALYGGADLFVVGQYDDSASVAAVAIGSQVYAASELLNWFKFTRRRPKAPGTKDSSSREINNIEDAEIVE